MYVCMHIRRHNFDKEKLSQMKHPQIFGEQNFNELIVDFKGETLREQKGFVGKTLTNR